MMYLYFLLAAVFSTTVIVLGNPVAEEQFPSSSLENFISFVPQDLAPNPDRGSYDAADALRSPSSNGKTTFQDFAIPADQQIGPNLVFDTALAPNSQEGEKIDDETALYRKFNCNQKYSVCCQGRDHTKDSQHMPCSEKIGNQYAGFEEVSSPKDMRYGQYCYRPFYTASCDDSLWAVLQDTKGMTCYTDCQIPVAKPQEQGTIDSVQEGLLRDDSLRDFHWRRF